MIIIYLIGGVLLITMLCGLIETLFDFIPEIVGSLLFIFGLFCICSFLAWVLQWVK